VKPGKFWRRPKETPKEMRGTPQLRKWAQLVEDRNAWNGLVQTTKTHVELQWKKKKKKKNKTKKKKLFYKGITYSNKPLTQLLLYYYPL
jgi:hypothetical protein